MSLQCPDYLKNSGIVGAMLTFEWYGRPYRYTKL